MYIWGDRSPYRQFNYVFLSRHLGLYYPLRLSNCFYKQRHNNKSIYEMAKASVCPSYATVKYLLSISDVSNWELNTIKNQESKQISDSMGK